MAALSILWIGLVAFGLALMTQIVNKLLINEKEVERNKAEMKSIQKELKDMDSKSKEFSEKQERALNLNMGLMKNQFKPMMFTILPYFIIFYFMTSAFAYAPMSINSTVTVDISGQGHVTSECLGIDTEVSGKFREITNITSADCAITAGSTEVLVETGSSNIQSVKAEALKIKITPPKKEYIHFPFSLPLVGDSFGWLGTFILFSVGSSLTLGRLLKGKHLRKWE